MKRCDLKPLLLFIAGCCLSTSGTALAAGPVPSADPAFSREEFSGELTSEELDQTQADLSALWAGHESEISTAEIDYLSIGFTLADRQLTSDQFCEELRQLDLSPDAGLMRRLVQQFCPEELNGDPLQEETILGAKVDRRTFRYQGNERRCISKVFEHVLTDELHLLVDHPNEDVHAYHRGGCRYWFEMLDWFRTVPNTTLFENSRISTNADGLLKLEYAGGNEHQAAQNPEMGHRSWVVLDANDGLPRRWHFVSPRTGKLLRLELYLQMSVWPGEINCPAVRIKANLKDERITHVQMSVIESARFNISFDEDAFRLSAPANWAWIDFLSEQQQGGRWQKPVADVAAFFGTRNRLAATTTTASVESVETSNWRSLLLIFNGTILIVIGVVLWRRAN